MHIFSLLTTKLLGEEFSKLQDRVLYSTVLVAVAMGTEEMKSPLLATKNSSSNIAELMELSSHFFIQSKSHAYTVRTVISVCTKWPTKNVRGSSVLVILRGTVSAEFLTGTRPNEAERKKKKGRKSNYGIDLVLP